MASLRFVKPEPIALRNHPEFNEKWVQDRIAEDPSILGLGDVVLRDKERIQPGAGRLDLLLQDADSNGRYEVEVQLGRTDESHIIRTLEYWDIERKRYPQYDHSAVIVAEDITSRFLNVINLFNGFIPLIALQMNALRFGEQLTLVFTKVMDVRRPGWPGEDEPVQVPTDRSYWEARASKTTVSLADDLLSIIRTIDPGFELNYTKFYIGLAKEGKPNNFAVFRPKKKDVRLEVYLTASEETDAELEKAGLDLMEYDSRWRAYRINLSKADIKQHSDLLGNLLRQAYQARA